MAPSNFKALFDNRNLKQSPAPAKTRAKKKAAEPSKKKPATITETKPVVSEMPETEKPLAKSKDPQFVQGNFYIRKTTHAQVKIKLLQAGGEKGLSDLVEELLISWLAK